MYSNYNINNQILKDVKAIIIGKICQIVRYYDYFIERKAITIFRGCQPYENIELRSVKGWGKADGILNMMSMFFLYLQTMRMEAGLDTVSMNTQ